MSATPKSPVLECEYPDCLAVGRKWEFHHGKYCSNECETKHEGWKALKQFRYNHAICGTCFRTLKTFNEGKPKDRFIESGSGWTRDENGRIRLEVYRQDVTASAHCDCGFQYLTEHATWAEKQRRGWIYTGTVCGRCGATDHTDHYPVLATRAAIGRLVSLFQADDNHVVDPHELHRVYEETADIDLAVGTALEDA